MRRTTTCALWLAASVIAAPAAAQDDVPTAEHLGWTAAAIGGVGRRATPGPSTGAWNAGIEAGYRTRVLPHTGWSPSLELVAGVRASVFDIDDLREPNESQTYVGVGPALGLPVRFSDTRSFAFVIEPRAELLLGRESAVNSPFWAIPGIRAGLEMALPDQYQLAVLAGFETWIPSTSADVHTFGSLVIRISRTWTPGQRPSQPVEIGRRIDQIARESLADVVPDHEPRFECELSSMPRGRWLSGDDITTANASCSDLVSAPVRTHECAAILAVAHDAATDVDLRTRLGDEEWDDDSPPHDAVSDEAPDGWPINVICNSTGAERAPHVELRRLDVAAPVTLRRYDVSLPGDVARTLRADPPPVPEITEVNRCISLHLPSSGSTASVRLPRPADDNARYYLTVFAPRVAQIRARLATGTVPAQQRSPSAESIDMSGTPPLAYRGDGHDPYLELSSPVIGAPVFVCVTSNDGFPAEQAHGGRSALDRAGEASDTR